MKTGPAGLDQIGGPKIVIAIQVKKKTQIVLFSSQLQLSCSAIRASTCANCLESYKIGMYNLMICGQINCPNYVLVTVKSWSCSNQLIASFDQTQFGLALDD